MFLAAAAAIQAAGGIANYLAQQSAEDRQKLLQDKDFQQWMAIQVPDPAQLKVTLDKYASTGQLSPVLEQSIKQDPTSYEKITTSGANKLAQDRALSSLEDIGNQGGLRLQDKAALQDAMLEGQVKDRAAREGIAANMAQRGLSNSGFDVAAQLQGQSAGADRDANNSLKVAATAQDRALQSLMGAGNLATQYRTQDYGEQAQKAAAEDRINQFNTQNMQNVGQRNAAAQNRAGELNFANNQDIANRNVATGNQQQLYNSNLYQQQFNDQLAKQRGISGVEEGQGTAALEAGRNTGNAFSNAANALGGAASSYGAAQALKAQNANQPMQPTTEGTTLSDNINGPNSGDMSALDEYIRKAKGAPQGVQFS